MALADKIRNFIGYDDEDEEYEEYYGEEDNRALAVQRAPLEPARQEAPATQQVVIMETNRFDDASVVVDHLKAGHTVVLNLQHTPLDVSRRMIDFISGAAYARDGQITQIASGAFIITPYSVAVSEDEMRTRRF